MLPVARPQRTIPECPSNSTPQGVWMYAPRKHRALPVLAATLAAVAVSAAPAFAGSDGDDESPVLPQPPAAVPAQPAPVQPAPVETKSGGSGGSGGSVRSAHERSAPKTKTRPTATRRVRSRQVATRLATQTTPQGGVQAGAGGTAEHGPDGVLLGLAGGALVLMASGGGLVARGRRGLG